MRLRIGSSKARRPPALAATAAAALAAALLAASGLAASEQQQSGSSARPSVTAVGGSCSLATARRVGGGDTVAGPPLCRPFIGPGSVAMAVMFTTGVCAPFSRWDMFELKGGSWRRLANLPGHGGYTGVPLKAVGNDLKESLPIRAAGDLLCGDDRGTKTRIWHWNGKAFLPGAWTYHRPNLPPPPAKEIQYTSPTGNIQCALNDNTRSVAVGCQTYEPSAQVTIDQTGSMTYLCQHQGCAGNAGEGTKFVKLAYGHSVSVGRFRCLSEFSGMTCVVAATGKGFEISKAGVARVE